MKRLYVLLFSALALCFLSVSLAQDGSLPTLPGVSVPDSVWYVAATVIGILVKALASPLTQLLKVRWGWQGNVTRALYAVLSLLFVAGFGLLTGAFGQGWHGWLSAGLALGTALVKGYGDYSKLVQTSAAGAAAAAPVLQSAAVGEILPPDGVIQPGPCNGLERL